MLLGGRCLHRDDLAKRICTCISDCRIRQCRAWRCREAALFDIAFAAPRIDLCEFNPLRFHVGLLLESFDTYRPISLHQGSIYTLRCVGLSGFPEDPSTPVKADDHRGDAANGRTLSETRERLTFEYCRHFYEIFLSPDMFRSEVTDTHMGSAGKPDRLATAVRSNKSAPIDSGSLYK